MVLHRSRYNGPSHPLLRLSTTDPPERGVVLKHGCSSAPISTGASQSRLSALGPFPFLRLPAELRNIIYRIFLVRDGTLQVLPTPSKQTRKHWIRRIGPAWCLVHTETDIEPAVLRVSRQVHREAAHILYGENRFSFYVGPRLISLHRTWLPEAGNLDPLHSPFNLLSPSNAKQLRHVELLVVLCGDTVANIRDFYVTFRRWLEDLAWDKLAEAGGEHHHLQQMDIKIRDETDATDADPMSMRHNNDSRVSTYHNQTVLEPLGVLCRVGSVQITGDVTSSFAGMLTRAMTAEHRLVEPARVACEMEQYRIKGKLRWRKKRRFRRYYDMRLKWPDQSSDRPSVTVLETQPSSVTETGAISDLVTA